MVSSTAQLLPTEHLGTQSYALMLQIQEGAHLWIICAAYQLVKGMAIKLHVLTCTYVRHGRTVMHG